MPSAADIFSARPALDDCWNRIGVRGDRSCPELVKHVHCRNCPVQAAAVTTLLDRQVPADHAERWTEQYARPPEVREAGLHPVVVFRVGSEWCALPTTLFLEVATLRPVHSLPHRRSTLVRGLVNVRGELLVCVSVAGALGIDEGASTDPGRQNSRRLLVLSREEQRLVFSVDEVGGPYRYHPRELLPPPATVARAAGTYTKAVFAWREKSVALLDDELLFYTLNRSLA